MGILKNERQGLIIEKVKVLGTRNRNRNKNIIRRKQHRIQLTCSVHRRIAGSC